MESLKQGPVTSVAQPDAVKVADHSIPNTVSIFGNKKGLHHLTYILTQHLDLGQLHFRFVILVFFKLNTTS